MKMRGLILIITFITMLTACTNGVNSVKNAASNSISKENIQYNDYISDSDNADIDKDKVYLHGMSGGGETG